jgi:hypothetical protein
LSIVQRDGAPGFVAGGGTGDRQSTLRGDQGRQGVVATRNDDRRLRRARPGSLVMVDADERRRVVLLRRPSPLAELPRRRRPTRRRGQVAGRYRGPPGDLC